MLTVITAARFEGLERHLLDALMQPGNDPFVAEPVLVPSAAVRRRLALAIADRYGVCAQVEFSFLAQWLWRQIGVALPEVPERSPYDPGVLRWRIDACLGEPGLLAAHPRLRSWVEDADAGMRFLLADRLAGLFDQYLTYRPDWLEAWSAGGLRATSAGTPLARSDEQWQAAIWRLLQAQLVPQGGPATHPAQAFLADLALRAVPGAAPGSGQDRPLPARVRVFCVPAMPPLYLDLLCGLARHVDIDLYLLNPCREYWFDLVSARELARRTLRGDGAHLEVGHRLLAAWGRQTQTWLGLLVGRDDPWQHCELDPPDAPPPGAQGSLLARLQDGIYRLEDPVPGRWADHQQVDDSLEIHVCHSMTRELEVLHDRLLDWMAGPDALMPGDILVVVPDLAAAAPLIEQVFGTAPRSLALPWSISGLPAVALNPLARAVLALLALASSRMPLSAVLATLQEPPLAEHFGLTEDRLEVLAGLLRDAGVHWGLDGAHRAACGVPPSTRGTLRDGLERLWLSHVLPDAQIEPWQGQLPARGGAPDVGLLDSLHAFLERLAVLQARLAAPLRPGAWQALLEDLLQDFLAQGRTWLPARVALLSELQAQVRELDEAAADRPLAVEVLIATLHERLAGGASGGVPTGAVTFAALPSLRSLPFRRVCVLGLDDGVFPGLQRPLEFDLIASHPRAGDRQRSEDERNLFLDLLLAARQGLYLSYSGRSARDNAERPPSVLLAELLDTVVAALCPVAADADTLLAMRRRLVRQHPLQPFDEAYFLAPGATLPRSHRQDLAAALRDRARLAGAARSRRSASPTADQHASNDHEPDDHEPNDLEPEDREPDDAGLMAGQLPVFFALPLPPLDAGWRVLELERLIRFLQHPARALLRDRLGLSLPEREVEWGDDEDFLPSRPAPQQLAARLLPVLFDDPDCSEQRLLALCAAAGDYPDGPVGQAALAEELVRLRDFAREAAGLRMPPAASGRWVQLDLRLAGDHWRLEGPLLPAAAGQQSGWEYADLRVRQELAVWVQHLWACAHAELEAPPGTVWRLRDARIEFAPLAPAAARLQLTGLLALYAQGMCRPLHFYPRSARQWLAEGEAAARLAWLGTPGRTRGESHDAAWRTALRGVRQPLDQDFEALARQVLQPMLDARR